MGNDQLNQIGHQRLGARTRGQGQAKSTICLRPASQRKDALEFDRRQRGKGREGTSRRSRREERVEKKAWRKRQRKKRLPKQPLKPAVVAPPAALPIAPASSRSRSS